MGYPKRPCVASRAICNFNALTGHTILLRGRESSKRGKSSKRGSADTFFLWLRRFFQTIRYFVQLRRLPAGSARMYSTLFWVAVALARGHMHPTETNRVQSIYLVGGVQCQTLVSFLTVVGRGSMSARSMIRVQYNPELEQLRASRILYHMNTYMLLLPILWRMESGKYPLRSQTSQIPMLRRCIMDACQQGSVWATDGYGYCRALGFLNVEDA